MPRKGLRMMVIPGRHAQDAMYYSCPNLRVPCCCVYATYPRQRFVGR